jgi:alpha-1,3-galactosidase A
MRFLVIFLFFCLSGIVSAASVVLSVPAPEGDATSVLQEAIRKAASYEGVPVVIRLQQGDYHISRSAASRCVYYISNTASAEENPDPTKHIGLWFKKMRNVTLDGNGAHLVTHGELTAWVIDSCENVTIKDLSLKAADPSVPEASVVASADSSVTMKVTSGSRYEIANGAFAWIGEGWHFSKGVAQVFYPQRNVTVRCDDPFWGMVRAVELESGIVRFDYAEPREFVSGSIYQMRHSIRNEVCGFIHRSKGITLERLRLHFMGNFGIVSQYSEDVTFRNLYCAPEWGTGRTCTGFADFIQMSGCKGQVRILSSYFEGAQDDPINIHGTHLKVIEYMTSTQIKVVFCHGQSYGFEAFSVGDSIELVDAHTLRCLQEARVRSVKRIDNYQCLLTLDCPVTKAVREQGNVVVENITWTPEVEIRGNYFARTPTRGLLLTTRKKAVVADNVFYRIPMSGILIADDARSWYESGPVHRLTIENNQFIECGSPVISIAPENDCYEGPVHRNVTIQSNRFVMNGGKAVQAASTDGLVIKNNYIVPLSANVENVDSLFVASHCQHIVIEGNHKR